MAKDDINRFVIIGAERRAHQAGNPKRQQLKALITQKLILKITAPDFLSGGAAIC
jgi:hypothetical protein